MSDHRVEYTFGALAEIEEIYLWIKERAPNAAAKWRDDLIAEVENLGENPLRHPVAQESEKFSIEIRVMLFRKRRSQLRVYYTVRGSRVVILTVRRAARRPLDEVDLPIEE
ncbi:type II toxin-antitoxin system RelE/ParE family toxin [Phragmitibacter flavus]|uniref:Type II toxin-antitoxin system RelE/ParE family toxin n=1 Tax=Phragmitibacter flavus TaxID=2576071 RepID=A0A5R8KDE8_9BACT|nr:type II toxin-antitoxin system RelE/ParE family toxin [Phragmitibacter flavus]TLD70330.1 type II toxin-antitoxin system RelE/ParE family toxin [Phragmitibacter flavus]